MYCFLGVCNINIKNHEDFDALTIYKKQKKYAKSETFA